MKMPCPNAIRCEGSDFPISNFSSEDPDREIFVAINWGWDYTNDPPLGPNWSGPNGNGGNPPCVIIAENIINQQEANNCALVAQIECADGRTAESTAEVGCTTTPSNPNPPPDNPGPPLFYNTTQVCNAVCPDGSVNTFVVVAGYFAARSQALADRIAHSYACNQARRNRICISMPVQFCCADSPFVGSVTASGATGPFTFSVSAGTFPTGLTLNPNGTITGTPTDPGTYSFTINAVGSVGTGSKAFTFNVLGITNDSVLPDATTGVAYSEQLVSGGGGITFSVTGGSLPTGLSMDDAGLITGTPTVTGPTTFEVTVVDAFLNQCKKDFVLSVVSACTADTGDPAPAVLPPDEFLPTAIAIPNWNVEKLGLVAPAADPAGPQPEWDGTLPVRDTTFIPGIGFWFPAGTALPVTVDLSTNGIKGDTGGIVVFLGPPWTFAITCTVGGVPTLLWQGTQPVGGCPVGTFMRDVVTPGISTGPACFHFTSASCAPNNQAWWTMDTGFNPLDTTDAHNAIHLSRLIGLVADFSLVAGQIANGLKLVGSPGSSTDSRASSALLKFNGTGSTIMVWVNVTDTTPDPTNFINLAYQFDQNGINHSMSFDRTGVNGDNWNARIDGVTYITKASAAGWHFLVLTFDAVTGTIGFDIDQSGMTTAATPIPAAGANTTGSMLIGCSGNAAPPGQVDVIWDELAVYDGVMTAAQLNYIYNAGAGKTWPPF